MTSQEDASLQERWADYQNLGTLRNHWYWRPGWGPGRQFYTWHITFEGQDHVHRLVTEIQNTIDTPGLDLVPLKGLHLTMQGVGFTDEVPEAELRAIIEAAEEKCQQLPAFDLALGPVDPDAEGVGLLIRPWRPVIDLRGAIRAAIATVWRQVPEPEDGFRPHVTIAYTGADLPTDAPLAKLVPLRSLGSASATISQVQLIALRREERVYEWDVVHTVGLNAH